VTKSLDVKVTRNAEGMEVTSREAASRELAGGTVMSLIPLHDRGIVVAVLSNIAHANTAALALKVAAVFAQESFRRSRGSTTTNMAASAKKKARGVSPGPF
jgi:hypothetical protein